MVTKSQLDKDGVETYLTSQLEAAYKEYSQANRLTLSKLCSNMVENINAELPRKCPSVDGFKYIVHCTVQVRFLSYGS